MKERSKMKIVAALLSLAVVVSSVSVPSNALAAKAKKAKLNVKKATLYVGGPSSKKKKTLKLTVNGKKVKATFKSNKSKIAKVGKKSGKVTAKKAGKAVITAKYKGKSYKCTVTVKKYKYVSSVTVSPKTLKLNVGASKKLTAKVKPSNATVKKLSYTSSNKAVATVSSSGLVKAVKAGTAKITVKAKDGSGKKAVITVTVVQPGTTGNTGASPSPTGAPATDTPATGAPATEAPATGAPATEAPATDTPATGAPATGAPATGAPATGAPATEAPTAAPSVPAKIELSAAEKKLSTVEGKNSFKLTATVSDAEGKEIQDAQVVWASSDEKVAKVSEGTVTAVAVGTAEISAKVSGSDISEAVCKVTVENDAPVITGTPEFKDYKTISLTFSENVKLVSGAALDKNVTVVDSVNKAIATKAVLGEDAKTLTITNEAGFQQSATDTRYKISIAAGTFEDEAGNAMAAVESVEVTKAGSYLATFSTDVTGIRATKDNEKGSTSRDIPLAAKDQYGQDMEINSGNFSDVEATASIKGGAPLTAEVSVTGKSLIKISGADLLAGSTVTFSVKNTAKKTDAVTMDIPVVAADVDAKAVKVSKVYMTMTTDSNSDGKLQKDDEFTIKAALVDALGYDTSSADNVIYTIDATTAIRFTDDATATKKTATGDTGVTMKAVGAGTAKVTAYLENHPTEQASLEVKVDPKARVGIYFGAVSTTTDILSGNTCVETASKTLVVADGANPLKPEELKASVTKDGKATTDVTVRFDYDKDTPTDVKAYILAAKDKAGEYKITIYTGSSLDDTSSDAVRSGEITYTAAKDPVVKTIEVEAFKENELAVGKEVTKKLTFINKNGEVIDVNDTSAHEVSVNTTDGVATAEVEKDADSDNKVTGVSVTGSAESSNTSMTIIVKGGDTKVQAEKYIPLTVVGACKITEMNIAGTVTVVNNDANDVVVPVSFKDQYGLDMDVTKKSYEDNLSGKIVKKYYEEPRVSSGDTLTLYKSVDDAGVYTEASGDADPVKFIGFKTAFTKTDIPVDTTQTTLISFFKEGGDTGKAADKMAEVELVSKADRVVRTFKEKNGKTSVAATAGSKFNIECVALDQYGEEFTVDPEKLSLTSSVVATVESMVESSISDKDIKVSVLDTAAADCTLTVAYNDTTKTDDEKTKEFKVALTLVQPEGITGLEIANEVTVDSKSYDAVKNMAYLQSSEKDIVLTLTGKAGSQLVSLKDDACVAEATCDIKDQSGNAVSVTAAYAGGTLTLTGWKENCTGTISITAKPVGNTKVTATKTIKVSSVAPAITKGTCFASETTGVTPDTEKKKVTSLSLDMIKTKTADIYVYGTTQYGTLQAVDAEILNVGTGNATVAKATKDAAKITVTALSAGTTHVVINLAGSETIDIPVTVK